VSEGQVTGSTQKGGSTESLEQAIPLSRQPSVDGDVRPFLGGGGEMGALMRSLDWARTPLGVAEEWSPSLRMMVSLLLANRFPMLLWWGPQYVQLYNDAYRPVLGTKHPRSMGQAASECWPEIWHIIGPLVDTPFNGGPATWMEDIFLQPNRHGYAEETHFTIAYSPVPDESAPRGIGGVLATVHEITEKVVGERRVEVLRELGTRSVIEARSAEEACRTAATILGRYDLDVPFALLYLIDPSGKRAYLAGSAGVNAGEPLSPETVSLDDGDQTEWPMAACIGSNSLHLVDDLATRFTRVPQGPWSDPPHTAVVLPIQSNVLHRPSGVLVGGVSSRLNFDEQYRGFYELLTGQVATAIANARAYEEEKRRVKAMAELDRAKTAFFSNVSHEFRTPLTLMLGPLRDALERPEGLSTQAREDVTVVHRNALRLLKLVNTLLQFSRIEAGRVSAVYQLTDLGTYTADIASSFRSAVERAGLELRIHIDRLDAPMYVDREMWEKIVLNLLSNAFKYTFEGQISVTLRPDGEHVRLEVRDTGVGIPGDQLPHVFERFHRVPNVKSRTHEGTGIGLALVQELVRLHGGTVSVISEESVGTTFTVRIPTGSGHLPADRLSGSREHSSTGIGVAPFVAEALRWLPDPDAETPSGDGAHPGDASTDARELTTDAAEVRALTGRRGGRILVADDNADMRAYLARLLGASWSVEAVGDGAAALAAVRRERPDLVLADVMMPQLDGFALLRELRSAPETHEIPIILLSARAGEESRVEGLNAGADDYLVKPFPARELIARVGATLDLAQARARAAQSLREVEQKRASQFETLLNEAPLGVFLVDADFRITAVNATAVPAFGQIPELVGRDFAQVMRSIWPPAYADEIVQRFRDTLMSGEPHTEAERAEQRLDRGVRECYEWQINRIPLSDGRNGVVCYFREISSVVEARETIAAANRAKTDFLAAMSHELRTPLNAIAGYVQLMLLGIHGPITTAQRDVLTRVQSSEQHLLSLINDVLNFVKLEAGRIEYRIEDVPLAAAVTDVVSLLEPELRAKGMADSVQIDRSVRVRADREKLRQVLLNLLANAIKFTDEGGHLTVRASERDDGTVALTVADTGIGIPQDKLSIIFDPFVQVHRDHTRPREGTGLGLAISRDLARGMEGDLTVESEVGMGSTFTLLLPSATPVRGSETSDRAGGQASMPD